MPINFEKRKTYFTKAGSIRKGKKVPVLDGNGKPKLNDRGQIITRPKEVPYFVFTTNENDIASIEKIRTIYGNEPDKIDCFLATSDKNEVWSFWMEAYQYNGLIARSDKTVITYLFDPDTVQTLVSTSKLIELPKDKSTEVAQLVNGYDIGDTIPYDQEILARLSGIKFKATGRLSVILSSLDRYAHFTVHTGGLGWDIPHIDEMVNRIFDIAAMTNYSPVMIPFTLERFETERKYIQDGKRHKRTGWDIQIEISPKMFKGFFSAFANTPVRLLASEPPASFDDAIIFDEDQTLELSENIQSELQKDEFLGDTRQENKVNSSVPDITPMMVINEGLVNNIPHAKALLTLLEIPHQGFSASEGLERIQLYYRWRKMYSGKNPDDRKAAAKHAIEGEEPKKLL